LWNLLFAISVVLVVVAGWYLLQKEPAGASPAWSMDMSLLAKASQTTGQAKDAATAAKREVSAQEWQQDSGALGSTVLDVLTQIVDKHKLQLSGFRTGKTVSVAQLKEAPFVATVEGSYTDLLGLLDSLDDPKAKLTVNMLEVTASEHASGQVIATLGLVAFVPEVKA
jgi:hypothetical protein